jgi:glycine/D-amino acid oxidase-like deaminating enzyme
MDIPSRADVVIVGGGIAGCSIAYHLTKLGITDVVLCKRRQLTCGTTWHAAGLVTQLRATRQMTELAQYTGELFGRLEAETGQGTGFRRTGSLRFATNQARYEELARGASMGRNFGLPVEAVSPGEIKERSSSRRARPRQDCNSLSCGGCRRREGGRHMMQRLRPVLRRAIGRSWLSSCKISQSIDVKCFRPVIVGRR